MVSCRKSSISRGVRHTVYQAYITSDDWYDRRIKLLCAHKYCLGCERSFETLQLHHISYDFLGAETRKDVIPVCVDCHSQIHASLKELGLSVKETATLWPRLYGTTLKEAVGKYGWRDNVEVQHSERPPSPLLDGKCKKCRTNKAQKNRLYCRKCQGTVSRDEAASLNIRKQFSLLECDKGRAFQTTKMGIEIPKPPVDVWYFGKRCIQRVTATSWKTYPQLIEVLKQNGYNPKPAIHAQ